MRSPSFKFYPDNFMGATQLWTDAQVGKYMRLLCLQYQYRRISEEDMLAVCKKYDKRIFDKFVIDESGLYYNERLEYELTKSNKYSESRSKNRTKSKTCDKDMKNICKTYDEDMKNIPEYIYEDEIDIDNNTKNKVPYKKILEKYNSSCGSLAKIKNISGDRQTHVEARVKEYGLESVYKAFEIAGQSDFLSGENDRGWKANFDWLMNTANMAKVLEGNYSKSSDGKPKNGDVNESGERYYDGKWYKL